MARYNKDFDLFLERIKNPSNKSIVEAIQTGYRCCVEGADDEIGRHISKKKRGRKSAKYMDTCYFCQGADKKQFNCPVCGGTKKLEYGNGDENCDDCFGTGIVFDWETMKIVPCQGCAAIDAIDRDSESVRKATVRDLEHESNHPGIEFEPLTTDDKNRISNISGMFASNNALSAGRARMNDIKDKAYGILSKENDYKVSSGMQVDMELAINVLVKLAYEAKVKTGGDEKLEDYYDEYARRTLKLPKSVVYIKKEVRKIGNTPKYAGVYAAIQALMTTQAGDSRDDLNGGGLILGGGTANINSYNETSEDDDF